MRTSTGGRARELVLVGGGHAHVQTLRRLAMEPPRNVRATLVVDRPVAVYSGMVPGFVAGQYAAAELEIDVVPLARRAGARVVIAAMTGIDAAARRIELEGRAPIRYDAASLDIGSTVIGLELPGVREHALPTRPIGRFVGRVEELVDSARASGARRAGAPFRVVVVGGGAGGVELAFTLRERLLAGPSRDGGGEVEVTLVESGERVLGGYPDSLVRRVERHAARRGIAIVCGRRVERVGPDSVRLSGGAELPADAVVWVAGARGHEVLARSGLPADERGFVRVRPTLQVVGHDELFACGDCATLVEHPRTPKAGVYAVRQGPYVTDNLLAWLAGEPLRAYTPQPDFLTLLNLGDGGALGAKWGLSFEGAWVMRLKDWIDRRFMARFQVLETDGAVTEAFAGEAEMAGGGEMLCGGCAAKVGQSALEGALGRLAPAPHDPTVRLGLERPDDAAAWALPGGEVVAGSLDAFRAFTDDPYAVGRVAAVNALSDLWAKGVAPRYAQALVAVPEELAEAAAAETLYQALAGARAALDEAGVTLLGGHSITAPELLVGFHVEGLAAGELPALDRLEPGRALILTKALGTGVLLYADMRGRCRGPWLEAALASMARANAGAARIAAAAGARAVTDVTGFGLAGHLGAMLRASGVGAEVDVGALPALPGAVELLGRGLRSTFHPENARARKGMAIAAGAASHPKLELLFDPQTSGGLLFDAAPEDAAEVVERLRAGGDAAAIVGRTLAAGQQGPPRFACVLDDTP